MEGPEIKAVEAESTMDRFGKRTLRFETGRLASRPMALWPPTSTTIP